MCDGSFALQLNSLYWAVIRRREWLRSAAGPGHSPGERSRASPETIGIGGGGLILSVLEAYAHHRHTMGEVCFYEYI